MRLVASGGMAAEEGAREDIDRRSSKIDWSKVIRIVNGEIREVDEEPLRNTQIQSVVARGDELFVATWSGVIRSRDDGETWDDVSGEDGVAPGYMSVRGEIGRAHV